MQWEFVVALVLVIPVIVSPIALVWYLNIGGMYAAFKKAREGRAVSEAEKKVAEETDPLVAVTVVNEQHVNK